MLQPQNILQYFYKMLMWPIMQEIQTILQFFFLQTADVVRDYW